MRIQTDSIPERDPAEAHSSAEKGEGVIVDVRELEELQQVAIADAIHIPLQTIPSRVSEIPRDKDVYVVCQVGQRSAMATEYLRDQGFDRVWNVRGGIIAWFRSGLPVDQSSTA
jgi:rhodanese-related sulfurtransferase